MSTAAEPVRPLDTTAEVETPEHVRFAYPLAGPTRRSVAYLIDLVIRIGIVLVLSLLLALVEVGMGGFDGMSLGAMFLAYFVIDWFYYVFFEVLWSGRSPGKRAVRLRVVGQDGRSLTALDSVLRNLLRAADFLPFGYAVGLVVMGRDPMFRRLGDMIAGTVVVIEEPGRVGERLHLHPPPTLEEFERLPARPPVSNDELDAIELFLRRRGTLAPLREIELAEMIAPIFARRMGFSHVHDPVRFLGLIYARARGYAAVPSAPFQGGPRGGWQHRAAPPGWPPPQAHPVQPGWQQQAPPGWTPAAPPSNNPLNQFGDGQRPR